MKFLVEKLSTSEVISKKTSRRVFWKGRVICKVHKNNSGMPPELRVIDDWCGRDIV